MNIMERRNGLRFCPVKSQGVGQIGFDIRADSRDQDSVDSALHVFEKRALYACPVVMCQPIICPPIVGVIWCCNSDFLCLMKADAVRFGDHRDVAKPSLPEPGYRSLQNGLSEKLDTREGCLQSTG